MRAKRVISGPKVRSPANYISLGKPDVDGVGETYQPETDAESAAEMSLPITPTFFIDKLSNTKKVSHLSPVRLW